MTNHKWRCFRRLYSLYSWLEEGKVAFVAGKQTKETSGRADSSSSNEPQRQNVWIRVDYGHGSGSKLRLQKSLFLDNSWRLKIARLVWKNTPKYWLYYHVWQRKRGQRSVIFNINGDRVQAACRGPETQRLDVMQLLLLSDPAVVSSRHNPRPLCSFAALKKQSDSILLDV